MSTQPEALRMAEALEAFEWNNYDAAAELRRLHQSEREAWRHADELEQERKRLHEANTELLEACKALSDYVHMEQSSTDGAVTYSNTQIHRLAFMARAAISKATSAPYNAARIAWELERTALGDGHYGNALRVAKDIPSMTDDDRAMLDRWANGLNGGTDHVKLQDLALRIDAIVRAERKAA